MRRRGWGGNTGCEKGGEAKRGDAVGVGVGVRMLDRECRLLFSALPGT